MPVFRRIPGVDALQRWLEARWYGSATVPIWLSALSRVYATAADRRRLRDQATARRLPVPVIVVGNLTVGGVGKTPVVIALVQALRAAGRRPGVISRGYGRSSRAVHDVKADSDPAIAGDEPVLIARLTGAPVVVGRDRLAAGRALIAAHDVDVVVADDGLQHYALARDVEIVVVDGRRRFGNRQLLPAGPMREPVTRLAQVDAILINGPRGVDEAGFDLVLGEARSLCGRPSRPLASFVGTPIHVVAGIGNPTRFFDALRAAGLNVVAHAFADHHAYTAADLAFAYDAPLLMTEKDAVKCMTFARPGWYALPVTIDLPPGLVDGLLVKLRRSVQRRRKRARLLQDPGRSMQSMNVGPAVTDDPVRN